MLYLGIDQHARQLTVSLRGEGGDVLLARQVSTEPDRVQAFFAQLTRDRLRDGESFVAVLEVCGFNDWLIRLLRDYRLPQGDPDPAGGPEEAEDRPAGRRRPEGGRRRTFTGYSPTASPRRHVTPVAGIRHARATAGGRPTLMSGRRRRNRTVKTEDASRFPAVDLT